MLHHSTTPLHHHSMPRFTLILFLALALASPLHAQHLAESITPRIGQRGTTVEAAIRGTELTGTQEIIFDEPGIRAVAIGPVTRLPKPREYPGFRMDQEVKCRFEIAPDCAPGEHRFRVRTATQLSHLATFHVTPFPVVDEKECIEAKLEGNDTPATAQIMSLDVTIRGSINNSGRGDVDLYRVPAKAGERLSVEVDCVRLSDVYSGGTACDLALRVIDAAGRELAANDENPLHVQDPLLSLKLPAGIGDHVFVEVRRSIFDRYDAPYALHLGRFERPLAVYPSGGPPGEKLSVTLLGDPLGDRRTEIAVPNPTCTFQPFGDVPSGLPMRSFAAPNVLEAAASETPVPHIPAALNGILARPGEMDRFRVKVKKGDRLRLRVYAATLGSPLDPFLNIRKDGESQPEISGDDASGRGLADRDIIGPRPRSGTCMKDSFDPSILWEPKSDGDYLIEIGANGGEGPTGVYRIEVMPPPDTVFSLLYARDLNTWSEDVGYTGLAVPQGNRWSVNVSLPVGQGTLFKGDMEIVAPGLPPGVTLGNTRISGAEHAARVASRYGLADWPVEFIAGPDAKPCGAVITLDVRSTDPAKKIETGSMQWFPFLNSSGGDAWRVVKTERFIMAVTDPAPFSIELQAPTAPLVRGGEMAIPVKLTRRVGFDEPIDFACDNAPVGVTYQPAETIPADRAESVLRLTADANARLGAGPLSVVAYTRRNQWAHRGVAGEIRVSAPIILLNVAEPYLALGSEPASVRRGGAIPYRWAVTPKTPFEGEAEVKLLGLPKGVSVREPFPRITAAAKEVVFQVEATDEALLGPVSNLECEVIVHAAGQEIRQRTGKGILRIDPKL
jgi:hypothetical protein